ncbi:hypothetical protein ACHQM5_007658 [Ranunculus cassubicifolius]
MAAQSNIPISEIYWSLVDKADRKFSRVRDLPYYGRARYDTYFQKVFKIYTQLWKFQQENRQKLVEAGLKRWEIGEIASRIAQLYYGQYLRTSEANYLSESYIFYEAILSREYFKDGLQDLNLANKQLRCIARFLIVCLVLNRREMVFQLVDHLKVLVDECRKNFQEADFKDWKQVVQEIVRFLKVDTTFMNVRPLRYSLVLDPQPDTLQVPVSFDAKTSLKLRDAILSSYHHNEVKFTELTLDTFRMLQCLEWEPTGSFYQSKASSGNGSNISQNGAPGPNRINYSQELIDTTLPSNPRKAILYRPAVTHFIAVMATICEELPPDGILLIYVSASGRQAGQLSSNSGSYMRTTESIVGNSQSHDITLNATDPLSTRHDGAAFSHGQSRGNPRSNDSGCLWMGSRGNGGINCVYPSDLIPFTRRPLFLVIDSDCSHAFKAIHGAEQGEPAAVLLSPSFPSPTVGTSADSTRHPGGSQFTMFLTAPLQAFCLLLGLSGASIEMDVYSKAEKLLSSLLSEWGVMLATSDSLDPVWAQTLCDPFLRRLLLRFIFCQAVIGLYGPSLNKKEYMPTCLPQLPDSFLPSTVECQTVVFQVANVFGVTHHFNFSDQNMLPERTVAQID